MSVHIPRATLAAFELGKTASDISRLYARPTPNFAELPYDSPYIPSTSLSLARSSSIPVSLSPTLSSMQRDIFIPFSSFLCSLLAFERAPYRHPSHGYIYIWGGPSQQELNAKNSSRPMTARKY